MTGHLKKSSVISGAGQAFSADLQVRLSNSPGFGILVPVIGLPVTCLVLAGLNVAAVVMED